MRTIHLLLALAATSSLPAFAQEPLWRPAAGPAVPELDAVEQRWRGVDLAGSEWLATEPAATVRLDLFDGESLVADLVRRETPRPGSAVWFSDLGDGPGGDDLLLAYVNGVAAATLRHDGRHFRLRGSTAGLILTEIDDADFEPCAAGDEHVHEAGPDRAAVAPAGSGGTSFASTSDLEEVDVLTAYTPAARNSAGGTDGIVALIDLAIAETNAAYANCDAGLYVRSVYTYEVDYSESSSISTDLSRFRGKTDGNMDEVHGLRNAYGADACALISNSSGACGVAYLMTNVSQGFQSSAFSVTVRTCAVGNLTYAHELGHNFGCAHDDDNAGNSSKPYAYGYRTPNNQYRTVMAYSPGQRVKLFSSPLHTFNGFVMGTASGEDNARALTLNAPTIANWRSTTITSEDCNQNGIADEFEIATGAGSDVDGDGVLDQCTAFYGDSLTVSLLFGGTQNLSLNAGPEHAGEFYILLGSLSGSTPPTPFFGVDLPLVTDAYFDLTLNSGGGGLLTGNFGILDAAGQASAAFTIPPIGDVGLVFTPAVHAYLTFDSELTPQFVSGTFPVYFGFF